MGTHRKQWSKSEKLEVISMAKSEGVLKASRHYEVSSTSIYKWMDKIESVGESGLEGLHAPELRRENRKLIEENKELSKVFWRRHIWGRGYFVATSGNRTDEVIMEYIKHQDNKEGDEEFTAPDPI